MSTIRTTRMPRAGSTYLVHRGSTMGRLPGGLAPPADRKATPSPLRRLSPALAGSVMSSRKPGPRAVCGRDVLGTAAARECALSDGNLPVPGKVPERFAAGAGPRSSAGRHRPARLERLEGSDGAGQGAYLDQAHSGGHRPRGVRAVGRRGQEDRRAGRPRADHLLLDPADRINGPVGLDLPGA